jgi:chemotaxis protein histidine kinase CheA
MSRVIFQADDSSIALRVIGNQIKAAVPDVELKQFPDGQQLVEALQNESVPPWAVFVDYAMPVMMGSQVLAWIKSHPMLHRVPVVMVTAEQEDITINQLKRGGAFEFVAKPADQAKITDAIARIESANAVKEASAPDASLRQKDIAFATEALERLDEIHRLIDSLGPETLKEIKQMLVELADKSIATDFQTLGLFILSLETFLDAIASARLFGFAKARAILKDSVGHLESQLHHITKGTCPPEASPELITAIRLLKENVDAGWFEFAQTNEAGVERSATFVRVGRDKLKELEDNLSRVIIQKERLNTLASELMQEFFDEKFPGEISRILADMTQATTNARAFFASLNLCSAARLKQPCARLVAQSAELTGKRGHLEFICDPHFLVDVSIIEFAESILPPLIRNAFEHGVEDSESRRSHGKDAGGKIKMNIKSADKGVLIEVADDGAGIDIGKIKRALFQVGAMTKESLESLNREAALELIFHEKAGLAKPSLFDVHRLVMQVGGLIRVSSTDQKGTLFSIKLPERVKFKNLATN